VLTSDDTPTIRLAINRRLGILPGVHVCDIKFAGRGSGTIGVAILATFSGAGEGIIADAKFELPDPFEHGHLLDELDEVAESWKTARRDHFLAALPVSERKFLPGTGMRGRWGRYGLRVT
jgi:hypothetical protein